MPSKSANQVISRVEDYLGRALTDEEEYKVEELVLNFYVKPICRYVDGLMKKKAPRHFDLVYVPIMNGLIRGAYRRHDIIYMKDRMKVVYDKMHKFCGNGMGDKELEAVIFMADNCTDREIESACVAARVRGVMHASYVKAIIEGNRKAASISAAKQKLKKEFIPPEYMRKGRPVPHVEGIRESWRLRIREANERVEVLKAELNAKKRIETRDEGIQ